MFIWARLYKQGKSFFYASANSRKNYLWNDIKVIFSFVILLQDIVGNKAKWRISKRLFQENKARQIFRRTNISYPLIRTRINIRNVSFSENFAIVLNEWTLLQMNFASFFWKRLYLLKAQSFLTYFSSGSPTQVFLLQEKHRFSVFQFSMYCFENNSEPKGWGRGARSEGTFVTF